MSETTEPGIGRQDQAYQKGHEIGRASRTMGLNNGQASSVRSLFVEKMVVNGSHPKLRAMFADGFNHGYETED